MRGVALVTVLAGCQVVFPLDDRGPSGADEDGDLAPNATDNCPGTFNDNQASEDGDEVGDACDPDAADPLDRIIVREFFIDGFGDASPSDDTLQLVGGAAETIGEADTIDTTLTVMVPSSDRTGLTAEVGFTVLDFGTPDNDNLFELRFTSSDSATLECSLSEDDPASSESTALLRTADDFLALQPDVELRRDTKQKLVMRARNNGGVSCNFNGASGEGTGSAEGDVAIAIAILKMRVRIDYLVVYDTTSTVVRD